ncbi:ABC transporter substrate-binding protein [Niallia sp. Krafla_26]|uniref:ABC transporter substrate-binding protein n=1 Tax=Niallia sp. Krafla_26 TaxID=3064703 RepID=UPI003D18730B
MKKMLVLLFSIVFVGVMAACSSSETTGGDSEENGDAPVTITLGTGTATEENLWLAKVASDLAPNYGEKYTLEFQQFRANTDRLNAYRAGSIVGGTIGQASAIMAKAQGVDLKVVANLAKDTPDVGFNNTFMALKGSGIKSIEDLKGKTIGIPDFKSPTDMWARAAVRSAGLDPEKDVKWAVLPIPAVAESVESGKIDVGMFPQPFYDMAAKTDKFQVVFTSKTGVPEDEDFFNLFLSPEFIEKNPEATQALINDLKVITKYYNENPKEARQKLLDAEMVLADPEIYLNMEDSNRDDNVGFNKESWDFVQSLLLKDKWIEKEIEIDSLVDDSFVNK